MRKIAIIGSGGSGNSTLAMKLGTMFHLPVHHLDALYWISQRAKEIYNRIGDNSIENRQNSCTYYSIGAAVLTAVFLLGYFRIFSVGRLTQSQIFSAGRVTAAPMFTKRASILS